MWNARNTDLLGTQENNTKIIKRVEEDKRLSKDKSAKIGDVE